MIGCLISSVAIVFFCYGLWAHDWRVIIVSIVLALVWPLIAEDVLEVGREYRHRKLLDELWDDDDLSNSA